jgi:hypothetical protein
MASWDRTVIFDPEAQKLEKNATQGSAFRMAISSPERRRLILSLVRNLII